MAATATLNEAIARDALLVVWDILTDLNEATGGDAAITKKLDQLRACANAMEIPKAVATKARKAVDSGARTPVLSAVSQEASTE
jgi:hypothetical protein